MPTTGDVRGATFRFYAELNDFLPAGRRGVRFAGDVPRRTTVKDAIESLGVPHPEVELLLVNGEPSDFGRVLEEGDDVSAFPAFQSLRPSGESRLRPLPPPPLAFIADVHLGRLTSLLRVAGFDTATGTDDEDLAATAAREQRVLLTRDVGLLKRGVVVHGYWVRHTSRWAQLGEVLRRFDALGLLRPFTRCARCNGKLEEISKEAVVERVPPGTWDVQTHFRACAGCGAVYWRGSHYERISRRLAALHETGVG